MKITMIGHCTVLIETGGKKIITDPYFSCEGNSVYKRVAPPSRTREELTDVDVVLLSHNHWDHTDSQYIRLLSNGTPMAVPKMVGKVIQQQKGENVVGMAAWETRSLAGIRITAVPALHMVPAIGFVIQNEGKQVYFAGDTYYHPFMKQVGQQFQLDAALIPVTAYRIPMTMDNKSAVWAVQALRPTTVIPIHLGVSPHSPLFRTNQTLEGFIRKLRATGLNTEIVVLREGQSWETKESER